MIIKYLVSAPEKVLASEPQLRAKGSEKLSCPICLETTITPREALQMMDAETSTGTDELSDWPDS